MSESDTPLFTRISLCCEFPKNVWMSCAFLQTRGRAYFLSLDLHSLEFVQRRKILALFTCPDALLLFSGLWFCITKKGTSSCSISMWSIFVMNWNKRQLWNFRNCSFLPQVYNRLQLISLSRSVTVSPFSSTVLVITIETNTCLVQIKTSFFDV